MKLEKIDIENQIKKVCFDLLNENIDISEAKTQFKNILRKKNNSFSRKVSKEAYATVIFEILRVYQETRRNRLVNCQKLSDVLKRRECKNLVYQSAINQIIKIKGQCLTIEHHQKRCLQRCNSLINFLQKQIKK